MIQLTLFYGTVQVKKRRQERELERQQREEEMALMQRSKEAAQFQEWERQEDQFHLEQARLRSCIRIQDGRGVKTCSFTKMLCCPYVLFVSSWYKEEHNTGCGRNSELIINKNNILLKVIDTNFSTSQFTVVLNFFFYIVSLFVYNVF